MITISTMGDKESEFKEMLTRLDSQGRRPFRFCHFSAVCNSCLSRGVAANCPHMEMRLPSWHSERKMEIIKFIMGARREDFERETLGVIRTANEGVFPRYNIDEFFCLPRFVVGEQITHIYVGLDPNTGQWDSRAKGGSDFAVVSIFETSAHTVLAGVLAIDAHTPEDYLDILIVHLRNLRSHRATFASTLVIAAEMNLGMESEWIKREVMRSGILNVIFMQEKLLRSGVPTTHQTKKDMMMKLRGRLCAGRLRIADTFTTHGSVDEILDTLKKQMIAFSEVKTPSSDPAAAVKVRWHGKRNGERDDIVIAMQLALYWSEHFRSDPKYASWHRQSALGVL